MPRPYLNILRLLLCVLVGSSAALADDPKTLFDYKQFGPGMNKNVPKQPLGPRDLERWARLLGTSEEQFRVMQIMYENFVKRHNEFLDREAPKYCAQSADLNNLARAEGFDTPTYLDLMKKVDQANVRVRRELTSIELSLIDLIEPILTEQQLERVVLLRDEANRRNCRTFWTTGRWRNVELREIWEETVAKLGSPLETEHVESLIADYERRLTSLVCRQSDLEFESRRRILENVLAMNAGAIPGDKGMTRYFQIKGRRLELARRVRLLHEQTVRHISEVLHEGAARDFMNAAKQTAYPEVYPDDTALDELFKALANDDELNEETQLAIKSLFVDYSAANKRACDELEAKCIEWAEQNEGGVIGFEPQFLLGALEPLFEKRNQVSRSWLARLAEALGSDSLARHAALVPARLKLAGEAEAVESQSDPLHQ